MSLPGERGEAASPSEVEEIKQPSLAAVANSAGTTSTTEVCIENLIESERLILESMLDLGAIGADNRRPQWEILQNAGVKNPEPKNYTHAFDRLRELNLIMVGRPGRGSGTWLTEAGAALAQRLVEQH